MIIIQICLRIISPLWIQITLERINSKVERLQLSLDQSISQCGYVYRLTCTLSLLHILFDKRQHQNKLNKTEVKQKTRISFSHNFVQFLEEKILYFQMPPQMTLIILSCQLLLYCNVEEIPIVITDQLKIHTL